MRVGAWQLLLLLGFMLCTFPVQPHQGLGSHVSKILADSGFGFYGCINEMFIFANLETLLKTCISAIYRTLLSYLIPSSFHFAVHDCPIRMVRIIIGIVNT